MFMKIFTILIIISFNNIFTLSQNINNDKTTANSLIRNKRQSEKIYNFEIKNLEKAEFVISKDKNILEEVNIEERITLI